MIPINSHSDFKVFPQRAWEGPRERKPGLPKIVADRIVIVVHGLIRATPGISCHFDGTLGAQADSS